MPSSVIEIENRIRHLCLTKRIRIIQFFPDFDELRSGFVTASQFFRCLYQTLGLNLDKDEEALLLQKYRCLERHKINYRKFCAQIDQQELRIDEVPIQIPSVSHNKIQRRSFGEEGVTMSPKLYNLLYTLAKYYQIHGICVKNSFKDFDVHNIGRVTESQFYRNFPKPPETGADDIDYLVKKYAVPNDTGLVNYLNLYNDIMNIYQRISCPPKIPAQTQVFNSASVRYDPSLAETIENIKVQAYKYGIRTTDFFKDYDKHKLGAITENQFMAALKMCVGKEAQLGPEELQKIVEAHRTVDGKVRYKEFCEDVEHAFTRCHLEKKPTENVFRPPVGSLARGVRQLTPEKEDEVARILVGQAEKIRLRNLSLFPFFKDYDRGVAFSRTVTKSQFARVLHFLQLDVSEKQLELLAEKFAINSGDINYPLYIQNVDPDFVAQTIGDVFLPVNKAPDGSSSLPESPLATFEELMSRLRHIVLVNRLKVSPNFEDFDPLRCGSITKSQFKRGLSMLGFSKIGFHDLTDGQFQLLCDHYENPEQKDKIIWTNFKNDIDSVFTQFNLEKSPMQEVAPMETFLQPKPGAIDWTQASEEHKTLYEQAMDDLRQQIQQRRILIEPVFKDFDLHGNQHITAHQFEQCLSMLNLPFTQKELATLKARFWDDMGINYVKFIHELLPEDYKMIEPCYYKLMKEVKELNERNKIRELEPVQDLESVLIKIKTKVFKERFRLIDFIKDYDKLNSGRVSKNQFHRALGLSPLELSGAEVSILADKYQSPTNCQEIDYRRFCDEVESIFTIKYLDKNPIKTFYQFQPEEEWRLNELKEEERPLLEQAMMRIADKVRERRIQLFPLMEDFDKVNNGSLSRSHFYRVLMQLELGHLFTDKELKILYKKFNVRIGTRDDFNYIAFCDAIYALAGFVHRRP